MRQAGRYWSNGATSSYKTISSPTQEVCAAVPSPKPHFPQMPLCLTPVSYRWMDHPQRPPCREAPYSRTCPLSGNSLKTYPFCVLLSLNITISWLDKLIYILGLVNCNHSVLTSYLVTQNVATDQQQLPREPVRNAEAQAHPRPSESDSPV